jgi:hypothetical protein
LLDHVLTVRIRLIEHFGPKDRLLSLDQVAGLCSVKVGFVGNFDQFIVALAPGSFVGRECQIRVAIFAVLADNLTVVKLILN